MAEMPPSEETPVYGKVQHQAGRLFMITCNEGWRSAILCDSMYEDDADWLLLILGRQPRRVTPMPRPDSLATDMLGVALSTLREIAGKDDGTLACNAAKAAVGIIDGKFTCDAEWKLVPKADG